MHRKFMLALFLVLYFTACNNTLEVQQTEVDTAQTQPSRQENSIQAVLWQERAAEYKALCYQAYNVGKTELDKNVFFYAGDSTAHLALITDLDETVMDNSPFNGKLIERDENYTKERWIEWGEEKSAKPVPGSIEFFKYAASKGVEIFYISNRYPEQMKATIDNLKKYDLPFVDEKLEQISGESSSKAERRAAITEDYNVILFIGDNLSDFSDLFEHQKPKRRHELTDSLKAEFGSRFIVLPNVMYGDWQTGIYNGRYDWTEAQKDSVRRSKVIGY